MSRWDGMQGQDMSRPFFLKNQLQRVDATKRVSKGRCYKMKLCDWDFWPHVFGSNLPTFHLLQSFCHTVFWDASSKWAQGCSLRSLCFWSARLQFLLRPVLMMTPLVCWKRQSMLAASGILAVKAIWFPPCTYKMNEHMFGCYKMTFDFLNFITHLMSAHWIHARDHMMQKWHGSGGMLQRIM